MCSATTSGRLERRTQSAVQHRRSLDNQRRAMRTATRISSSTNWFDNLQPTSWILMGSDGQGKTKIFANYARFIETPIRSIFNVRAVVVEADRQELQR
jgi:hypothetical protein